MPDLLVTGKKSSWSNQGMKSPIISYNENLQQIAITIKKPSLRYLNEFIRWSCGPDLLMLGLFPNAKEITESLACHNAARSYLKDFKLNDPDVHLYVIGDGVTPRTAAVFAFMTAWQCFSVDPNLRKYKSRWNRINRLTLLDRKMEEVDFRGDRVIIIAPHSHVDLKWLYNSKLFRAGHNHLPELAVIALPCCVPLELHQLPDWEYEDWGIHSPHRTIKIWRYPNLPI